MIAAVLPAAGRSRRMGRPKLLLPLDGVTILSTLIRRLQAGGVPRVLVVTAPGRRELVLEARQAGARTLENPDPSRGMLSSVQTGVAALLAEDGGPPDGILVSPADHPAIRPRTVARLIGALEAGAPLAVPLFQGRRGHPLGVAAGLLGEILELDPRVGLRQLVERHRRELRELPVDDPGVLQNVNTPADYEALRSSL